jgi:hypothetical protein
MTISTTLPVCSECTNYVIQSFHAIIGGRISRLCSETCRRAYCAKHVQPRPDAATAACWDLVDYIRDLPELSPTVRNRPIAAALDGARM